VTIAWVYAGSVLQISKYSGRDHGASQAIERGGSELETDRGPQPIGVNLFNIMLQPEELFYFAILAAEKTQVRGTCA
jgi:hypothetical protein